MKPSGIALLLLSLTLLHTGRSDDPIPEGDPPKTEGDTGTDAQTDPPAADVKPVATTVPPVGADGGAESKDNTTAEGGTTDGTTDNNQQTGKTDSETPAPPPPPPPPPAVNASDADSPATGPESSVKTDDSPSTNKTAGGELPLVPSDAGNSSSTDGPAPNASPSPKAEDTPNKNETADKPTQAGAVPSPSDSSPPAGDGNTDNKQHTGQATDDGTEEKTDNKILWVLLPVLLVCVAGVIFILKYKCMKVQDHIEPTENGTENASFQRSESNKDGVMLLGVKSSGAEENAAAR